MRKQIAAFLLIASVVAWGLWCGGQVFNELMVVPKWSASPPETIKAFNEIPRKGGAPFFVIFNPLFVILAILSAIFAWKQARRSRKWLALSVIVALAVFASLMLYLVPLVGSTQAHAMAGDLPATEIIARVEEWKFGNRTRLCVELCGFVFSIVALRVWSAESNEAKVSGQGRQANNQTVMTETVGGRYENS